jgi:hypothetical protein
MLELLKLDPKGVVTCGDRAGQHESAACRMCLDHGRAMLGGKAPHRIDVVCARSELPGEILPLDPRLRPIAAGQIPHFLAQRMGGGGPQNDADLQVFRGIGPASRARSRQGLSVAIRQCMARHVNKPSMRRAACADGVKRRHRVVNITNTSPLIYP